MKSKLIDIWFATLRVLLSFKFVDYSPSEFAICQFCTDWTTRSLFGIFLLDDIVYPSSEDLSLPERFKASKEYVTFNLELFYIRFKILKYQIS